MLWFLFIYFIAPLLLLVLGLIIYARWNWGTLENQGMTVIPPEHFLLGSAMLTYKKAGGLVDIDNMRKYGPVFGLYEGREAQVFICDAELIRKITTKDSDYFDAKRPLDFGDPLFNEFIDFQPKDKWKFLRQTTNPILSSSLRLKNSNPAMREAIYDFIKGVKQQIKEKGTGQGRLEKFCVTDAIFGMLTDLMARSQFSVNIGKSDVNNRFVQLVKILMTPPGNQSAWISTYAYAFPFIKSFLPNNMVNPEPSKEFCIIIKQMIEMRRKQRAAGQGPNPKDFLDTLVEWYDQLGSAEYKQNGITEVTIFSLGIMFFIAAQDQISLILGAMLKHISENPEIERKCHEELDSVFSKSGGVLDHEKLSELTYVTATVTEATRLYPFFYRTERVCTKDWKDSERGLKVKKGDIVQIAIWATHRNPEYYDKPDEFNPDRFLPGNREKIHPYAFVSFGFGPRNCPGKRLGMEILVLLAAHLLKELRFLKRSDTKLEFIPAGPFFGVCEPIYLDVESRN